MVLLMVLNSAGGHDVLDWRNGSVRVGEMFHFGGGNPLFDGGHGAFGVGKWWIQAKGHGLKRKCVAI
jgi:hypothetical protein